MVKRCETVGIRGLEHSEVQQLAVLYRQSAADLSTLRQDPSGRSYNKYLSQLTSRAHNIIYRAQRVRKKAVLTFFTQTYPAVFARNLNFTLTAIILFTAAGIIGVILTLKDPDFALSILGPHMISTIEKREMWTHSVLAMKPVAASGIMTNNLSVAFTMFSAGITAGLGTLWLTIVNGLLIGVIGSACYNAGMSVKLWSFVAPHGALELPAIFIAAGAGFRIAFGLLFPKHLSRRDSLIQSGSEAVQLLLGVIPMLILAGLIEGFFSPSPYPVALKFAMSAGLFILLSLYLFMPVGDSNVGEKVKADSSL